MEKGREQESAEGPLSTTRRAWPACWPGIRPPTFPLDDPGGVAVRLASLRDAGAHDHAAVLASQLPAVSIFGLFPEENGSADQFRFGPDADGTRPRHGAGETLDL